MNRARQTLALLCLITIAACTDTPVPIGSQADAYGHTPASEATQMANRQVANEIAQISQRDAEAASRGLIARAENLQIEGPGDTLAWDLSAYDFIRGEAPDTVNPSLWRQAGLNNLAGLYEVTDGVYQIRGFDLANMTLIAGDSGWIVVDPLTSQETARAALAFAHRYLPERPVKVVLFTHSHVDHFGGVLGVTTTDAIASGAVQVVAPEGFMAEATSENVIVGQTMGRRSEFMYGMHLDRSARGHVGSGLGKAPAQGATAIASPTLVITKTPEAITLDGVPFIFQRVSGSEAPAEFTFYLPEQNAFCGAELLSRNLHNLYTLRGAKVRDALRWSGFIDEALQLFPNTTVIFNSHHWPVWGQKDVGEFLTQQRDTYKYIHDQTLRLAGQGLTPDEIADTIALPKSLQTAFHNRDYYGTVKHNARAVYQFYFGWYNARPATLDPLPTAESSSRYIALMGGADSVLAAAQQAFDEGDYRWVAELLNRLVFAEPNNVMAKAQLAATYDQLGYQAESGPWRDVYLSGAYELRHGVQDTAILVENVAGLMQEVPIERILELVATLINGPEAEGVELTLNFNLTDRGRNYVLTLKNSVLNHRLAAIDPSANTTINLTHQLLLDILLKQVNARELLTTDALNIEGSGLDLIRFLALLQVPNASFAIAAP